MAESLHILLGTSACLQWLCHSVERTVARGPLVFLNIFGFFVENHMQTKNPVSMTYGLRVIIIAGNGPYFSHYFQFLC